MYRRHSDDIRELRKRGLPWLASAVLLLLLLIFGISIFIFLDNQNESSKRNLLFRWRHGSFEDYDEDDAKTENGSIIYITPLRKHGESDEYSSNEEVELLLSSTTDSSITSIPTTASTDSPQILSTYMTPFTTSIIPKPTNTLPPKIDTTSTLSLTSSEEPLTSTIFSSVKLSTTPSIPISTQIPTPIVVNKKIEIFSTPSTSPPRFTASTETTSRVISTTPKYISTVPIKTTPTPVIPIQKYIEKIDEIIEPTPETSRILLSTAVPVISTNVEKSHNSSISEKSPELSGAQREINDTLEHWYSNAAVSCSEENCSEIGRNILLRGGNSVDAAIASDFCMGAMHPHKAGLGGSSVMLIYQPGLKPVVINGVSTSPRSATYNTFAFNSILSKKGYSSIACPGNLATLWNAFNRYGSRKLKWQDLVLPTIELLDRGFEPSEELSLAFSRLLADQKLDPIVRKRLSGVFSNRTMYRNDPLAQTLRKVASSRDPYQLFYRGDVASQITQEIRSLGAILTKLDFINYVANIEDAISIQLDDGRSILGSPPPMTSLISQLSISHIIKKYKQNNSFNRSELLSELKSILGKTEDLKAVIADPIFSPDLYGPNEKSSHGFLKVLRERYGEQLDLKKRRKRSDSKMERMQRVSSNIHVIDNQGVAVSLVSSLNGEFGAQRLSNRLGFFWNNYMAEFSMGESETEDWNSVQGSKKPRTSISPLMVVQNDQIESMIGLSSSSCFDSILAQAALNYLLLNGDEPQIFPNTCDLTSSTDEVKRQNENVNEISLLYKKNNLIYSVCNVRNDNTKCSAGY